MARQCVDAFGGRDVLGHAGAVVGTGSAERPADTVGPQLQVIAGVVGREGSAAEAFGGRQQMGLGRPDPLTAVVDDQTVAEALGEHPPADSVGSLQDDDVDTGIVQRPALRRVLRTRRPTTATVASGGHGRGSRTEPRARS